MAIAYQAISTITPRPTTPTGTVTYTLTEPAGSTTDDLLVACISFRGNATPSIPATWTLVGRTTVAGNTNTNNQSIGSGLMAYIKRGATAPDLIFGSPTGFPDLVIGGIVRINGQDLTNPLAGFSVNTLATNGTAATTGGFTRSFVTDTANDYLEVMMCIGAQEVTWTGQTYTGGSAFTERGVDTNSTNFSDGSLAVATGTGGVTTGGFGATASANTGRHSLLVASFGGPAAPVPARSFVTLF